MRNRHARRQPEVQELLSNPRIGSANLAISPQNYLSFCPAFERRFFAS